MTMKTVTRWAPGTTKYRFYTILTGKITKAFFRAMKYTIFLETHLKLRGVNLNFSSDCILKKCAKPYITHRSSVTTL